MSRMERTSSTPLLLAASISIMSTLGAESCLHTSHLPQASPFTGSGQFTARANILATVVLPVPRGPVNRYACAILPLLTCALSVFTVISCPITSSKQVGRQARYSALYAISASLSQSGSNRLPQNSRYSAALCILRRPHGFVPNPVIQNPVYYNAFRSFSQPYLPDIRPLCPDNPLFLQKRSLEPEK